MTNINMNKSLLGFMLGMLFLANANVSKSEVNHSQNKKSSSKVSNPLLKEGKYSYSNYEEDPKLGTSIGVNYTITISHSGCKIDVEGYQVDNHSTCEVRNMPQKNLVEIFDKTNNITFGYIKKNTKGKYFLRRIFDDNANLKPDPRFYRLDKVK